MQQAPFNTRSANQFDGPFKVADNASTQGHFAAPGGAQKPNSLVAFLAAIRFLRQRGQSRTPAPERGFAQPHPQARQPQSPVSEYVCVRSAN